MGLCTSANDFKALDPRYKRNQKRKDSSYTWESEGLFNVEKTFADSYARRVISGNKAYCIRDKEELDFQGDYFTDLSPFKYLNVEFKPCEQKLLKGDKKCAPTKEVRKFMKGKILQLVYLNSEIDLYDFTTNPTTYSLNSNLFYNLDYDRVNKVNLYVSPLDFEREENKILQYG